VGMVATREWVFVHAYNDPSSRDTKKPQILRGDEAN